MIKLFSSLAIVLSISLTQSRAQSIKTPIGTTIETQEIEAFLAQQMQGTNTPGLSLTLINDGKIAFEINKGMARPDSPVSSKTIFEGASISKPLFSFFVMKFVEKGLLDLDKPLFEYLPYEDIAHDVRYKTITARMVLTHQTGFPNWRTDTEGNELTIDFDPGTGYQYSGEGFQYLALVLQGILKTDAQGLEAIFQKEVALPLSLQHTKFIQNKSNLDNKAYSYKNGKWNDLEDYGNKEFGAAYGVHTTSADFANWLIALMNNEGLNENSYHELLKDQIELPDGNPNKTEGISHMSLGFFKGALPFGMAYGHGGNNDKRFSCLFVYIPQSKWGMVLLTNSGFGQELGLGLFRFLITPK
ncbi:serine hydrolase [Aureisphaera galaxeae]|uniref:serine hydrolase domain-containing protein n=1 Tax=Aureisphaera galaxeae TaxID=1538023 RepID=UPI0023502F76|nr:serine hydrolase domain-containing protein [Aureisphaera galaxeae]MDC8005963.1 serine hydrolase [Aureisphaera galaxeae]